MSGCRPSFRPICAVIEPCGSFSGTPGTVFAPPGTNTTCLLAQFKNDCGFSGLGSAVAAGAEIAAIVEIAAAAAAARILRGRIFVFLCSFVSYKRYVTNLPILAQLLLVLFLQAIFLWPFLRK